MIDMSDFSARGATINAALEIRGLCKHYKQFDLNDLSFDVPVGHITGFIGPNGSGKTTAIKLILNMALSDSGSVHFFGQEKTVAQNAQIGVVMDAPFFVDDWEVREVEKVVAPLYKQWDKVVFADYLKQFELDPNKKVKELSRGMVVKLQIAVALSHGAELLILDEPTSGLDPVARDEVCDLLSAFVSDKKRSVMFSTHITSDLEKIADFIVFILKGNIVFTGDKQSLLAQYVRIIGNSIAVDKKWEKSVIGYRERDGKFEGLVNIADIEKLPMTVSKEKVSLDELVVYMDRGTKSK
jgi:ABC-2 type transport system ATP-binding protein